MQSWHKSIGKKITSTMMFTKKKIIRRKDLRTYLDQKCKKRKLLLCLIGACESPKLTIEKQPFKIHNHWEIALQDP